MIGFTLTEEQEMFRKAISEFASREIAPLARACDERGEYPMELFRKMGALGYLGIPFPAEYGGSSSGYLTTAILAEELGYASAGIALGIYVHVALALTGVATSGTDEQKRRYLAPGITGEKVGAWGFAEAGAGSDPGAIKTRARRDGDGYVLSGSKMFITNGTFADFVVVTAMTAPEKKVKGLSLFIIERGTPGFSASQKIPMLGMRAAQTAELVFDDCRVPAENRLGAEDTGFLDVMKTLTLGRIMAAAFALGLARAAFDESLRYANERVQFGQPIGQFQGLQWMLADMAVDLEAARVLTWQAAWRADQGLPHIKEASIAKLFATEAATRIAGQAVQIHGGYGFTMESSVQRFYRDAKLLEIGEGTSQIHRNVIAKQLGL
jgi:alkylation response protein AidB-like acyl-CoA dehydrogenase